MNKKGDNKFIQNVAPDLDPNWHSEGIPERSFKKKIGTSRQIGIADGNGKSRIIWSHKGLSHRGSYMSIHNKLGKRDKMQGCAKHFIPFCNKFNKFNNTETWILDLSSHMTLKVLRNLVVSVQSSRFYHTITATCDFQQFSILTRIDSDELRNSKWCSVRSLRVIEYSSDWQWLWSDCT